jgi:hypothetical protein
LQATAFSWVRDYEVMKVEQDVPNEFLLVIDDGESLDDLHEGGDAPKPRRAKGAYYKNIERKMMLKKRRGNVRFSSIQLLKCRLILEYHRWRHTRTSGLSSMSR